MLARSQDSGQNWNVNGIAGLVSEGYDFTYNANGHLVVVWNTNNNYDLFVSYSTDYGATWSQPISVINYRPYFYDFHKSPAVAIDNSGHVYVIWLDDKGLTPLEHITYFNHSNNFGLTWQTELPISANQYGIVNKDPKIICDDSGNVYATWIKTLYQSPNVLYFNNSNNYGQAWVGSQDIAMYADKHQIQVADNGNVYLVWNDIASQWIKIKFRSSFDHGASWQSTVMVTNEPHNCELGNFDFSSKGNSVYLAWENLETWQGIFYNFSKNGGITWQTRNGRVDENPGEGLPATNKPTIAVDSSENVYVAWEDARNGQADIYFNRGDFVLELNEKIKLEADYILSCQYLNPGDPAHGAINDVYAPDVPPDYVVPRENGMAILGLLKAYEVLGDSLYLQRANLSMDYLVSAQEDDGSWRDEYDYRTPPGLLSKSPTQPAEVMIAMFMLGYRDARYDSMKAAAQYLLECQIHGYQGLIVGGKDAEGNFYDWNWITDNSYAYWAFLVARSWAMVKGENVFAQQCEQAAIAVLNGINLYFYNNPDWWTVVDQTGYGFYHDFGVNGRISWMNVAPQFLDLPATGVGSVLVGEWIHSNLQQQNGGCIWGGAFPEQEYPGISFQSSFCWFDLEQNNYADAAVNWTETSSLWQLVPDEHGISGGWVDWININNPNQRAGSWERYIDTSFYSIASWLGGYDFRILDNLPPILTPIGNKSVYVGDLLIFQINATDPEGRPLTYSATNLPSGASFNAETRIFSWTPISVGTFVVRFEVSDGYLIDYENVTITVSRRGGGCFLAGTPILLADGSQKPIEEIKVGDIVMAYDEGSAKLTPDKVSEVFSHPKENTYLIINNELRVTPIHPVLSKGEWRPIGELAMGDTLTSADGKNVTISSIVKVNEENNIYNFEVERYHTYVAGGYIVHNRKLNVMAVQYPEDPR